MVLDYYQKNPSAAQGLKGALYEEKILSLFKSKINLKKKDIATPEAEKIISDFNKQTKDLSSRHDHNHDQDNQTKDTKETKASKSSVNTKKKTKKVSKK